MNSNIIQNEKSTSLKVRIIYNRAVTRQLFVDCQLGTSSRYGILALKISFRSSVLTRFRVRFHQLTLSFRSLNGRVSIFAVGKLHRTLIATYCTIMAIKICYIPKYLRYFKHNPERSQNTAIFTLCRKVLSRFQECTIYTNGTKC